MAGKLKKPITLSHAKARHKYHIGQTLEAGIRLLGGEIKSLRAGKASIAGSFVRIEKGKVFLRGTYMALYPYSEPYDPYRARELLLHKKEIRQLSHILEAKGKTIVPLKLYFKEALAKVEIAVAVGKKLHDKRETLKRRTQDREAARALSQHRKRP